jgi:hypothetical protein
MTVTVGGLQKGWYGDAEEPGLSRYWDGTRWSGVRRTMRSATATWHDVSLSRRQRFWYGHVVRLQGVRSLLRWSNRAVPGLQGRLEGAITPPGSGVLNRRDVPCA